MYADRLCESVMQTSLRLDCILPSETDFGFLIGSWKVVTNFCQRAVYGIVLIASMDKKYGGKIAKLL